MRTDLEAVVFLLFKMRMILDGYCLSYLLQILIHDLYRMIFSECCLLSFWALVPEILFQIYQSVVRIPFAGETRRVSVAICRPSINLPAAI